MSKKLDSEQIANAYKAKQKQQKSYVTKSKLTIHDDCSNFKSYDKFFEQLLGKIVKARDEIVASNDSSWQIEPWFPIAGANDQLYVKVVSKISEVIVEQLQLLLIDRIDKAGMTCLDVKKAGIRVRTAENQTVFIVYTFSDNKGDFHTLPHISEFFGKPEDILYKVYLVKRAHTVQGRINAVLEFQSKRYREWAAEVQCLFFDDFFEKMFGRSELQKLQISMHKNEDKFRKAFGYQITEIVNDSNMRKLKRGLVNELLKFDYDAIRNDTFQKISEGIMNNNDFRMIIDTFLYEKRYELLLGHSDFAKSIITSEWLYKQYFTSDEFDNTFMVSGFLKSIEQFLWNYAFFKGRGRLIENQTKHTQNVIDKKELNTTLNDLEVFISNNKDFFVDSLTSNNNRYLKAQIGLWRSTIRNGHFHKHDVKTLEEVKKIRDQTYFLYAILLGSLKLDEETKTELGG